MSRQQLLDIGLSSAAVSRWVDAGRLVAVEQGVFAVAPILDHDDWGRWMAATLTAPGSILSHLSAAAAWELLSLPRRFESVTRPGSGGPRRYGGVIAYRSSTLDGDVTTRRGIPITSVPRTLLDLARTVGDRALARALREAVRLELTTLAALGNRLGEYRGRGGRAGLPGPSLATRDCRWNALAAGPRSELWNCCEMQTARFPGSTLASLAKRRT